MAQRLVPWRPLVIAVVLGMATGPLWAAADLDAPHSFNIPTRPLEGALRLLAKQADLQILFAPALVENRTAPTVEGSLAPRQALAQMLSGTHLVAFEQSPGVVVVREQRDIAAEPHPANRALNHEKAPPEADADVPSVEEVVVT